mmetsp:Transcript_22985/g.35492  ORF Transcript_22985/g.35492 Transcript_22985/m.35492 type:complete len:92 (-) Transcript_22985:2802-3077(-)
MLPSEEIKEEANEEEDNNEEELEEDLEKKPLSPRSSQVEARLRGGMPSITSMQISSSGKIKPKLDFSFDEKQEEPAPNQDQSEINEFVSIQ